MRTVGIDRRGSRLAGALATLVLLLQFSSVDQPRPARADSLPPCGTIATPPPTSTTISHVVWIVMENKGYSSVIGSANAPYINSLASQCGLATNFDTGESPALPSLPHYIAMTSGSTQGITDNKSPSAHPLAVDSIFSQLGAGRWSALQESMPANCTKYSRGEYAVRHNPAAYYTDIRTQCAVQDVPLGAAPDISAPFTFITPNLTDSMHRTATNTTTAAEVKSGDDWLAGEMPLIFASPEYTGGSTAVFLTWDEGTIRSDHIPTLVLSPYTAAAQSTTAFTHYSMLKTTEEMLGLPLLGHAADPGTTSMASDFGLDPEPLPVADPCGTALTPPPAWEHVVWIVMENKTYATIVGSSNAPYINSIVAQCGVATNFYAVAQHMPKIAMTSGDTQGITDENPPADHPLDVPSIFSQAGSGNWRALEESMPSNCYLTNYGQYAVRHNPAAYYVNVRDDCMAQDIPLDPASPDISAKFTYITPNLPHSMHGTATNKTTASQVRAGDAWLSSELPLILNSPAYLSGTTAIFLTWDESNLTGQVPTVVISPPTVPGTRDGTRFDHYSMLKTTQELLGFSPPLGNAATADSMAPAFNLTPALPPGGTARLP